MFGVPCHSFTCSEWEKKMVHTQTDSDKDVHLTCKKIKSDYNTKISIKQKMVDQHHTSTLFHYHHLLNTHTHTYIYFYIYVHSVYYIQYIVLHHLRGSSDCSKCILKWILKIARLYGDVRIKYQFGGGGITFMIIWQCYCICLVSSLIGLLVDLVLNI